MQYQMRSFKMADLAGPKKAKKDEKAKNKTRDPRKALEIPEDSVRDPRTAENCQKNAFLCHLVHENAPEEKRIFSNVTQKL